MTTNLDMLGLRTILAQYLVSYVRYKTTGEGMVGIEGASSLNSKIRRLCYSYKLKAMISSNSSAGFFHYPQRNRSFLSTLGYFQLELTDASPSGTLIYLIEGQNVSLFVGVDQT